MSWYTVKESHDNGEYRVQYDFDLLARAMEVLEARHAEMGDRAFEVALAEIGYVKQRTCRYVGDDISGGCSECHGWLDPACSYCPSCGARVVE